MYSVQNIDYNIETYSNMTVGYIFIIIVLYTITAIVLYKSSKF